MFQFLLFPFDLFHILPSHHIFEGIFLFASIQLNNGNYTFSFVLFTSISPFMIYFAMEVVSYSMWV
jgi:hypothetical protein